MIEFDYLKKSHEFISATDEVGRGPLAGPVVSACVIVEKNLKNLEELLTKLRELGVNDSKKLTEKRRKKLLENLGLSKLVAHEVYSILELKKFGVRFFIQEVSNDLIDEVNILNASLMSMKMSYDAFGTNDEGLLLIDGNKCPKGFNEVLQTETIVKGDSKSALIGLASVIAKEYRDELMKELGEKYPGYGLEGHAGYPTKKHKEAIERLGVTPIHRKSFKGVKEFVASI